MKRRIVAATTHVDRHYHRLTKEGLERLARGYNGSEAGVLNVEHDRTLPPIGKMIEAWVEPTDDGEYQLVVMLEEFDDIYNVKLPDGTMLLGQRSSTDDRPFVSLHHTAPAQTDIAIDPTNFRSKEDLKAFLQAIDEDTPITKSQFSRKSWVNDAQTIITLSEPFLIYLLGRQAINKIQGRLADEVADDAVRFYRLIRSVAVAMARYTVPKNRPITYIFVAPGKPTVEFAIRTTRPDEVYNMMQVEHLSRLLKEARSNELPLQAKTVQYLLQDGKWKFNYLLTDKGEVIGTQESFLRRARRIELAMLADEVEPSDDQSP